MQVTYDDRIVTWQLNRPEQNNGLDIATMQAMESSLTELEREGERLVCLLVVGQPAVFSTGLDNELLETCFKNVAIFREVVERSNRLMDRLEALSLISIACVEGLCRLGGLELALACDLIVAAESASINDGHVTYDAMPGGGATRRLPARVGYSGALRFILQNETLTGPDAFMSGRWMKRSQPVRRQVAADRWRLRLQRCIPRLCTVSNQACALQLRQS